MGLTNHEQMERLEYKMEKRFFCSCYVRESGSSRDLIIRDEKIEKKVFSSYFGTPPLVSFWRSGMDEID